ncbi:alpha-1,2-fucosyltransferase [Bacillus sp. EB600]|uniref:alpha-1,2-fucosyltransferase n=1 Tax=Bacillus sp. EB600 TaxID=2806345 RepID=UPI0021094F25|nr:alpha-1,2-fucosyltransferase [Bacillus sp. EB600]MCQ6280443.1 alpha-1,2-fucosyltransferase [Bacillus sp. EB600]
MESKHEPRISMSTLGKNGRFGNQILQYIFLKVYGKRYGIEIETPEWIGNDLFELNDQPNLTSMPVIYQSMFEGIFNTYWREYFQKRNISIKSEIIDENVLYSDTPPYKNVDFWGYFGFHFSHYLPYREYIQSLLQPSIRVRKFLEEGTNKLKNHGKSIVGIHIRRGDHLNYKYTEAERSFYCASTSVYKKLLKDIWSSLDEPVLFIASDNIDDVLPDFKEYNPITSAKLFHNLPPFLSDFYSDFYILCHSDILAISNSTFSFLASILNKSAVKFYRPNLKSEMLIEFDPWKSSPYHSET